MFAASSAAGATLQPVARILFLIFSLQIMVTNCENDDQRGSWPWCDSILGCLDITDDWYSTSRRPYNFLPSSREKIGTQFFIHTRKKRNVNSNHEVIVNDARTLEGTGFDARQPTKFIIHGFIDNGNLEWLKEFAQEFLDYENYNVFRVNWGGGSLTLYGKAVANTRVVGLEIGYFVNWLVKYYDLYPADVHLLGHSLGSHIAGYAGEQIPGLGRISGLDPAGPYFTKMPSFVRLDETDAIFVDNYHTDAASTLLGVLFGFGTTQAMGNIDFYPNGGRIQPGCDIVTGGIAFIKPGDIIGDIKMLVSCSHSRVKDLYRETLKQSFPHYGLECSSYISFKLGRCGSCKGNTIRCSPIGIRASEYTHKERINVKMYVDTKNTAPFFGSKPNTCEDESNKCAKLAAKGKCTKGSVFTKCKLSCACGINSNPKCVDTKKNCPKLAAKGKCSKSGVYTKCRASCTCDKTETKE